MKITPIKLINTNFQQKNKNNYSNYSYLNYSKLQTDSINFSGKNKKIEYTIPFKIQYSNPFEDAKAGLISPSDLPKKEILAYSKYFLPCPCCGDIMIPPQLMDTIKSKITDSPSNNIQLLKNFEKFMHPVEKQIFSILEKNNKKHPNLNFHDILRKKYQRAEKQLVIQQISILSDIRLFSRDNLTEDHFNKISKIIENASNKIFNKQNKETFSRKQLIEELETFANIITAKNNDPKYKNILNKIIEKANTLPTSYNSIHAFIVKYAKNKYNHKSITERLLSGSEATIEHATPEFLGGKTIPSNLINECARDNHSRGHDNIIQQIREHPQMPYNMQKHFDKLIELSKQNKVNKSYITEIAMTYYKLSKGLIDVDLSKLWVNSKNSKNQNINKQNKNPDRTPTKAERREIRKLKIKRQKAEKRKYIITSKNSATKRFAKSIFKR